MDILICANSLELGGAERALLGLLSKLATTEHHVDLFLCRHYGDLLEYLPKEIRLLPEDKTASSLAIPIEKALKKYAFGAVLGRLLAKCNAGLYIKKHNLGNNNVAVEYSHRFTFRFVKHIRKQYDLVIGFHEPHYIAAYRTHAKRKVAWMHTDYKTVQADTTKGFEVWNTFDAIVAISDDCKRQFVRVYPTLAHKVIICENLLPTELIMQQANAFTVENEMPKYEGVNLLSIGRYCYAKNFDNVPDICRRMLELGANVRWYIIGFGGDEDLIRAKIVEAGMEDRVILLGKKENPYPYIKACDLYVQPSRYEGKSISVREAQLLGKPVVITDYPTAKSQINNHVDGIIVPMDNQGCAAGIVQLIYDTKTMTRLTTIKQKEDCFTATEISKVLQL